MYFLKIKGLHIICFWSHDFRKLTRIALVRDFQHFRFQKLTFKSIYKQELCITLLLRIEKYHKEQVKVFLALMRSEWNGYRSNVKNDLASISTFEWHLKCKLKKKMKVEISGWIRERNLTNIDDSNDHLLFLCILCDYFKDISK